MIVNPDRSFSEFEPISKFEDFRVGSDDGVDRLIFANDFDVDFARCDCDWTACLSLEELEPRVAHTDEVRGWIRNRSVHSEHRELNLLTGLYFPTDDNPIGCVPAADNRAAHLSNVARELTVDPDFGVVIKCCFEHDCRIGRIVIANAFRNRHLDAIPVETDPSGRAALIE